MPTELLPIEDRVAVRAINDAPDKVGSLYIPDIAKEKPQVGEVVAVGPGRVLQSGERVPVSVTPGMRVLYGKYSGTTVTVEGEPLLILRETDLLAAIRVTADGDDPNLKRS